MLHIGGFGMLLSLFPFLFVFLHLILAKELKVIKRGKIELVDETQLLGPDVDYSQEFEAEAKKGAQLGDLYDEQLAALPRFEVHKNGKNIGWTRMPVLNQKKAHWSTPLPRLRFGEPAAATYSTPKLEPITLGPPFPPTPLESIEVETLPPPPPPPPTQPPETPKTQQPTTTAAKPKTTQTAKTTPVPATTEMAEPTEMSTKLTQKPTTKSVLFSTQKSAKPAETQKSTGVPKSMEIPSRRPFSLGKTSPSPNSVPSTTRTATSTSRRPQQDDDELAAAAASARLRKKLLVLRPKPHGTEVEVKSNKIAIRPFSSSPPPSPGDHKKAGFGSRTTPSSLTAIPGGFAWSRSWSIGPDGRIEIRTWDRDHGHRVEQRLLSSAEKQRWLHGGQGGLTPPLADITTRRPALIQAGAHRQQLGSSAAAAFECRLLDAAKDGQPSEANDPSCPLDFPGIPSDGSCKCNYQVSDRDAQGCATGFIYTCVRRQNSAAGPDEQEPAPFAGARRRQ